MTRIINRSFRRGRGFLTAGHVVAGVQECRIRVGGAWQSAHVVHVELQGSEGKHVLVRTDTKPYPDWALVHVADAPCCFMSHIAESVVGVGSTLYVCGYPAVPESVSLERIDEQVRQRTVVVKVLKYNQWSVYASGALGPGFSGSPAILPDGRVVGVYTSVLEDKYREIMRIPEDVDAIIEEDQRNCAADR